MPNTDTPRIMQCLRFGVSGASRSFAHVGTEYALGQLYVGIEGCTHKLQTLDTL